MGRKAGERLVPLVPAASHEAPAARDPGVVEQQVDVIGLVCLGHGIAERQHLGLLGDIGHEGAHARAVGRILEAERPGLLHVLLGDIADRHVAAQARQLTRQLAPHACPAARDHGQPSIESIHVPASLGRS
jgi:hypothetical protein